MKQEEFSFEMSKEQRANFLYKNINADPKDYNGNFIFQTLNITNQIVEMAKIKEN